MKSEYSLNTINIVMRQFIDIINESIILSERHSYATMLDGLINSFARFDIDIKGSWVVDKFNEEMTWARKFLKREDRIVWYLRIVRSELIHSVYLSEVMKLVSLDGRPIEKTPLQRALIDLWNYEQERWSREMGYDLKPVVEKSIPKGVLSHYIAMADQIPALRNYKFDRQSPKVIQADLRAIEKTWREEQEEKNRYVSNKGEEVLITFPDGLMWVHLKRPSCDKEGKAMGHCGNKAAPKDGDTILSLRKPSDKAGLYNSLLTFILHKDGHLGEMKGRFNEKPEAKYHPHIIELLKNPIIKGIRGGGYAASRNFSLGDLREKDYAALIQYKPSLKK